MSHSAVMKLHHLTKLLILAMVIVATEYHSNYGLYAATILWLEFSHVVKMEKKAVECLIRLRDRAMLKIRHRN